MSIKKAIENEIKLEKSILSKLSYNSRIVNSGVLLCRVGNGRTMFYIRNKREKKAQYISKKEFWKAEMLYREKVKAATMSVLQQNLLYLERALENYAEYDIESVINNMPKAYQRLKEILGADYAKNITPLVRNSQSDDDIQTYIFNGNDNTDNIPQSENPKDRAGLKYKTSFGLMVRSKNEMLIAEALYAAGIMFLYEARLELVEGINDPDSGREAYNTEVLYPDFTILLPDGERLYWEHLGMWENKDYREDNMNRLTMYFNNGIYPPKNLILTVDGIKMPFDNSAVWRLIEGQILSRY